MSQAPFAVIPDIDAVLFDVGGTLVEQAPPATAVDALVARPLHGVVDTLRALAGRYRVGAVTDTATMHEADVRALLATIGLDELLEVVVTSQDVGAAKPDPRGLLEACRRLDVAPSRVLFVGDRPVDRDAAQRAGATFAAVDRGLVDALQRAAHRGPFSEAARDVVAADRDAAAAAANRQAQLTKPAGSLGRLEALGTRLSAITGRCPPPIPNRPVVAVFAADHGVAASGVTPWPQDITTAMVVNFARGGAAINVLARQVGADVAVVDVGVASDVRHLDGVQHHKIRPGTDDLTIGPAMSTDDALAALDTGARIAQSLIASGHDLLVTGEMGIGNTTPSAALISVLAATSPHAATGRGTGIDDDMLAHKVKVIANAAARAEHYVDPISVLAEVGGLEIGALAGYIVAGAAQRVPVVIDGVIACAALLLADALVPGVADLCIAGHRSTEPGASVALAYAGLEPLLDLDLRLGEGTGACLAIPLVQAAARILHEMATFDELER
jgi:nicotinate-nucleotide--dimethylbenzimidazole phosphoribosyltransferase